MTKPKSQIHDPIFEPDVILPAQLLTRRTGGQASGEQHLMLAVMEDAINCYQKFLFARNAQQRRLFREAEQWMMGEAQEAPLSFKYVCQMVGLEPEYIRRGLREWRQRQFADALRQRPEAAGIHLGRSVALARARE